MRYWLFIFMCYSLLFGESCNEFEECSMNPYSNYVVAEFNVMADAGRTISFDSVVLEGYGRLPYDQDTLVYLALPLDMDASGALYHYYTDSIIYTLGLTYKKEGLIYELHCDASVRFYDLDTTNQTFDSLVIVGRELNLSNYPINFEIYL
ncbi:MAG: hypothetical protein HQ474_04460 [Flammeovirgaceae bacterium]|jgi:hypothetical protein|nr:hypothetical protein [Flammeovirgaceae bacterium]